MVKSIEHEDILVPFWCKNEGGNANREKSAGTSLFSRT